eukprot:COSAG02_NODE_110_length_36062_cov_85.812106_10_plen_475_part_00
MRSTRRSSGRFQEEAASREEAEEEEEAALGQRERRRQGSRGHGEQQQGQEQAERRSSRRAVALKRPVAEMGPPLQQRALRRRRSIDPDSEAPQREAGDAEERSSGRATRRSARVKSEPDEDDGIQEEEDEVDDAEDDQPARRPRNLRQRPKARDLAAENLDLEESSEEGSSEEESSEEESSEEDSDEDEEEEEGNRRRSARARTETQRYEPRLGGGEDEEAAPWRGHGRLERRSPTSRGSAGGARGGSSRRVPARRGGSTNYRSKRSRRSAAGRADSDEDDLPRPRRRSNSSRRDRRRRGGGGGARSDDSLNSEEEVEQRRIRSLARQRANVRPINASYLPSGQPDANGLNAFGTGDAGAGGSAAKLGQIDVEPIEVDLKVNFDEIGGLGPVIHSLKEMISLPLLYPEIYERFSISPPRGVLFYGPPGTGKTLVAKALAASCSQGEQRVAFFMRNGADCLSKWVGEAERQLRVT